MLGFYIYQFAPILLVEGFVLWRMKWGSFPRSLFDSLLMNFTSFLGLVLGLGPYIAGSGPWGLTLFGTYSIMVEGTLLMLLERHPPKLVWSAVLIANLLGCIVLDCEVFFSSIPWNEVLPNVAATHGGK
jgi:hypothetical protein